MNLHNQYIYLRLLKPSDAESMSHLEARNRDFFQLTAPLRDPEFYTTEGQLKRIKKAIEMQELDQNYSFGVFLTNTDELIGNITLSEVVRADLQSCWIGYSLDKNHNGRGIMTEAVRLVVSYAFHDLKLHRIEAGVMPHNVASIKVLEKAGFHQEGLSRKNVKINGEWQDHVLLAIINDENVE